MARLKNGELNGTKSSFDAARARCTDPSHKTFKYYGGRGVTMRFASWRELEAYLGPRPRDHHLDRLNPRGNYEPGNVRWLSNHLMQRTQTNVRFNADVVSKIKRLASQGIKASDLGLMFNAPTCTVRDILKGRTWNDEHIRL